MFPEGGGFVNITVPEGGPTATGMNPEGGTAKKKLLSIPPPPQVNFWTSMTVMLNILKKIVAYQMNTNFNYIKSMH